MHDKLAHAKAPKKALLIFCAPAFEISGFINAWVRQTHKLIIRYFAHTQSDITVADPFTGEVKNRLLVPYPNFSALLTTAGGLVFTGFDDDSFVAYDDTSL
jgi:hypothetical protein